MIGQRDHPAAQALRFLLVGATSSATYLIVLSASVELLATTATVGVIIAYSVGTIVSYLGSTLYAFNASPTGRNVKRFLAVVGTSFVLNVLIAYAMERMGIHYLIIGITIVVFVSVFNFVAHRYWTYSDSGNPDR